MNGGPAGTALDDGWAFGQCLSIFLSSLTHSPCHPTLVDCAASPLGQETVSSSSEYEASETEGTPPPAPAPIYIIAHSERAQRLFDMIPLSWGVQYEIARGVSQGAWSWETVVESEAALRRSLCGPNTNASRVSQVLGQSSTLGDSLPSDDDVWCVVAQGPHCRTVVSASNDYVGPSSTARTPRSPKGKGAGSACRATSWGSKSGTGGKSSRSPRFRKTATASASCSRRWR